MKKDFLDVELDREKTRTSAPERAVHIIPYDMDFTPTVLTTRDDVFFKVSGILTPNEIRELIGLDKMKG